MLMITAIAEALMLLPPMIFDFADGFRQLARCRGHISQMDYFRQSFSPFSDVKRYFLRFRLTPPLAGHGRGFQPSMPEVSHLFSQRISFH
jgi:hypothetical protein